MNITDILFNAAGGGILGSALHCLTNWLETKQKIALMNAQVAAAEKTEAWKAFAASQVGANETLKIPENVPAWVSSFYVCVDGIRQLTRPLLTWAGVAMIVMVYQMAPESARAELQGEIVFGSFTAIFWWYGSRYVKGGK